MKPLHVSVGLERRGAKKTDVIGAAGAPTFAAEQYIDFRTEQVVHPLHYIVPLHRVIQLRPDLISRHGHAEDWRTLAACSVHAITAKI
jgi:hypothetical protein